MNNDRYAPQDYLENLAEHYLGKMEDAWGKSGLTFTPGMDIPIARYETQSDFFALRPESFDYDIEEHKAVIQNFAISLAQKHGVKPRFVTLTAKAYRQWRKEGGHDNTCEAREYFIQIHETKPIPTL